MDKKRLLKHLVFLMFFIFIADLLAKQFYWYYTTWYFDIFMHFLGGVWVGLFFIYVFSKENQVFLPVLKVIFWVLAVGILWEVFELFSNNYIGRETFDILDTFSDLVLDLAGGLFAVLYCLKKIMLQSKGGPWRDSLPDRT